MNNLYESPQTHIKIGKTYFPINQSWKAALITRDAFEALTYGEIDALTARYIVIDQILGFDERKRQRMKIWAIEEAVKEISDYIKKYVSISGGENDKRPDKAPMIDFAQDAQLIIDAYLLMGDDLRSQDMPFYKFMSKFREMPECLLRRIIYLRTLIHDGRIKNKEHKADRKEIDKIGRDIVYIKDRRNKGEEGEHSEKMKAFWDNFNSK